MSTIDLSTMNCVIHNGPVTNPCACFSVCALKYGIEVRRLRTNINEVNNQNELEEAYTEWKQFIAEYAPKI